MRGGEGGGEGVGRPRGGGSGREGGGRSPKPGWSRRPKTGTAEARRVRVRSTRGGVGGGRARTERTCGIVSPGKDDAAVARRGWDASIVPARARGRGEDEWDARGLIALSTTAPPRVTSRVVPARDFALANGRGALTGVSRRGPIRGLDLARPGKRRAKLVAPRGAHRTARGPARDARARASAPQARLGAMSELLRRWLRDDVGVERAVDSFEAVRAARTGAFRLAPPPPPPPPPPHPLSRPPPSHPPPPRLPASRRGSRTAPRAPLARPRPPRRLVERVHRPDPPFPPVARPITIRLPH